MAERSVVLDSVQRPSETKSPRAGGSGDRGGRAGSEARLGRDHPPGPPTRARWLLCWGLSWPEHSGTRTGVLKCRSVGPGERRGQQSPQEGQDRAL